MVGYVPQHDVMDLEEQPAAGVRQLQAGFRAARRRNFVLAGLAVVGVMALGAVIALSMSSPAGRPGSVDRADDGSQSGARFDYGTDAPQDADAISEKVHQFEALEQETNTEALFIGLWPVDDQVVWASGTRGTVSKTVDGGENWETTTFSPEGNALQYRDIHAFDEHTAFLMSIGTGNDSRIYRTDNGGDDWTLSFKNEDEEGFIDCMSFWSPERGIVYGDQVDGYLFVLTTDDGGDTWNRISEDALPAAGEGEAGFAASGTCAVTGAPGTAWIATGAGGNARVLKTTDFGETWSFAETPVVRGPFAGLTSVAFLDNDLDGVAFGGDLVVRDNFTDNIAFTVDGGASWALGGQVTFPGSVYGGAFRNGLAVAGGPNGVSYSPDQGLTWEHLSDQNTWTIAFGSDSTFWVGGPGGRITRYDVSLVDEEDATPPPPSTRAVSNISLVDTEATPSFNGTGANTTRADNITLSDQEQGVPTFNNTGANVTLSEDEDEESIFNTTRGDNITFSDEEEEFVPTFNNTNANVTLSEDEDEDSSVFNTSFPTGFNANWTASEQESNTTSLFIGLWPVNDRVVWASGVDGTVSRTVDGGETWETTTFTPDGEELQYRDIHAFDEDTAFLMSAGNDSRIYRTEDGGRNWALSLHSINETEGAFIDCMSFWTPERGIVFGDSVDGVLFVLTTEDGGETWDRIPESALPAAAEDEAGFAASGTCAATGAMGTAWIATGSSGTDRVLKTTDFGASWNFSETPTVGGPTAGLTSVAFTDNDLDGVAFGGDFEQSQNFTENVAITRDGGASWTAAAPLSFPGAVYGGAYRNGVIVAAGPNGVAASDDLGESWSTISDLDTWSVAFGSDHTFWAVGRDGSITRHDMLQN